MLLIQAVHHENSDNNKPITHVEVNRGNGHVENMLTHEVIRRIEAGETVETKDTIPGKVHIVRNKDGSKHISTDPDEHKPNNLNKLQPS